MELVIVESILMRLKKGHTGVRCERGAANARRIKMQPPPLNIQARRSVTDFTETGSKVWCSREGVLEELSLRLLAR
jgi:hypothetical protein